MNGNENENSAKTNNMNPSSVCLTDILYRLLDKIIFIVISAVIGAVFVGVLDNPTSYSYYSSTSKIYVTCNDGNTSSFQNLSVADDLIGDCIAAFSNLELHENVIEKLDLPYSSRELSGMISVNNIDGTHILSITVTVGTTADEARLLAAAYAEASGDFFKEKFNIGEISVFEKASEPSTSHVVSGGISPALGVFAGIILSCAVIVFSAMLDDRIYTPEDITRVWNAEVLGIMCTPKEVRSPKIGKRKK